jgi:hypothetical protein
MSQSVALQPQTEEEILVSDQNSVGRDEPNKISQDKKKRNEKTPPSATRKQANVSRNELSPKEFASLFKREMKPADV